MKIVTFNQANSILNQYLAEVRNINIQGDSLRFRRNIERIGEIMAYEISRDLPYHPIEIQTPLAKTCENVPAVQPVLATILRAGLPLHQGFLNYFDHAENAFVSAYRKYIDIEHFDIHIEYIASPRLDNKILIITDPMLATGGSCIAALQMLKDKGVKHMRFMCIIAAPEGVKRLQEAHPDVDIYIGALDDHLNEHKYIVPGLGDAGDRIFGTK